MKLRTSPVFYFGILLVLAIAAALAAPYVVDWNQYRAALEDYGQRLTGRKVAAAGDIKVRLFPWPKLSIGDVHVSNPPGSADPDFLKMERLDVQVALGGLFSGSLDVQAIDLIKPELAIARSVDGRGNWVIAPELSLNESRVLDHVRLDQITIHDGALVLADGRRQGRAVIEGINGTLSSPAISGPWRSRATANYGGRVFEAVLNTGQWSDGAPFKFSLRLSQPDGSGFVYSLDGATDALGLAGGIRVEPGVAPDGKADAEGALRAHVFQAKVKAGFDRVDFSDIQIAPREQTVESGGNLLEGSASVTLGRALGFTADLKSAKFDLDQTAGGRAKQLLREGGGLALLSEFLAGLPKGINGRGKIKVGTLVAGGENLQNAVLDAEIMPEALRINELSARMPGQSEAVFNGVFLETYEGPQLAGDIAAESKSFRDFVKWVWPEQQAAIAALWTGSRGRVKFEGRIDALPGKLRISDAAYQIDDSAGTAAFAFENGAADLRIEADLVDIDSFLPGGITALAPDGGAGWGAIAAFLPSLSGADAQKLILQAAKLRLNGVEAEDVAIDVALGPSGLDLKTVEIGKVGDAKLELSGQAFTTPHGPQGAITAVVQASHPRGLIRLLGFVNGDTDPSWVEALGATNLKVNADLKPEDGAPGLMLKANGVSGDFAIDGTVALAGSLDWRAAEISAAAEISSASSQALAHLAGFAPASDRDMPGKYTVAATGALAKGLVTDVQADVFGGRLQAQAKFVGDEVTGHAGVAAERPEALLAAIGAPFSANGLFTAEADFARGLSGTEITNLKGFHGQAQFSGALSVSPAHVLSGEVETDAMSFGPYLAGLLLPWNGGDALEGPFAAELPFGLTGELWVRPKALDLFGAVALTESAIGLTRKGDETRINAYGKTADGQSVNIDLGLKGALAERQAEVNVSFPVSLTQILKRDGGRPVLGGKLSIEGQFKGAGRSPVGVLASLSGQGKYEVSGASVEGLAPGPFLLAAETTTNQSELDRAFAGLFENGSVPAGDLKGTLTVAKGLVSFESATIRAPQVDLSLAPAFDLATASLDMPMGISFKSKEPLPPMKITYVGEPQTLTGLVDSSQLLSALGIQVLKRGVAELERLQREQQRLLEEEERQRKEDAARVAAWEANRREIYKRVHDLKESIARKEAAVQKAKEEAKQRLVEGAAINKVEIARFAREIRMRKRFAKLKLAEEKRAADEIARKEREAAAAIEEAARRAEQEEADRLAALKEAEKEEAQARADREAAIREAAEAEAITGPATPDDPPAEDPVFGAEGDPAPAKVIPLPKEKPLFKIARPKGKDKLADPVADAQEAFEPVVIVPPAEEPGLLKPSPPPKKKKKGLLDQIFGN